MFVRNKEVSIRFYWLEYLHSCSEQWAFSACIVFSILSFQFNWLHYKTTAPSGATGCTWHHTKHQSPFRCFSFVIWWCLFYIFFICLSIDMDAQDASGNTPLHITVEEDAFDAMNYLLSMYVEHAYAIIHGKFIHILNCTRYTCVCVRACSCVFSQWRQCKYFEREEAITNPFGDRTQQSYRIESDGQLSQYNRYSKGWWAWPYSVTLGGYLRPRGMCPNFGRLGNAKPCTYLPFMLCFVFFPSISHVCFVFF